MHYTQCEDTVAAWGSSPEGFLCSLRKHLKKVPESFSSGFSFHFVSLSIVFPTKNNDIFTPQKQNTPPSTAIVALTSFSTFFDGDSRSATNSDAVVETVLCTRSDALNSPGSGYPDCPCFHSHTIVNQ